MKRYTLPKKLREQIIERDGRRCQRCDATEALTVDHRVAVVNGGGDEPENLWTLCLTCNIQKGANLGEEWLRKPTAADLAPLRAVEEAKRVRDETRVEYTEALCAAVEAGESYARIARAAGISRQSARKQTLNRTEET